MPASVEKLLNSQYVQLALAALAFLIALWFVVVIARMLMGGRLRLPGGRTRQARLGIVDAFDLDRQRQLIIVRRDNTEHLIMIGGPNDLLIESEIVRAEMRDGRRDESRREKADGEPRLEGRAAPRLGLEPANGGQRPDDAAPFPVPQAPAAPADFDDFGETPRGPTFPLPARRPAVPPMQPERRPLPERSARPIEPVLLDVPHPADEPAMSEPEPTPPLSVQPPHTPSPQAAAPQAPLPQPTMPAGPAEAGPQQPAPARPMPPLLAPVDRPVPSRPSPFLKPLPPRPPLRPLKRVTPQAVPPAAAPAAVPEIAAEPRPAEQPSEAPRAPQLAPGGTPPVASEPAPAAPKDGLESLEEEMAKLLGR